MGVQSDQYSNFTMLRRRVLDTAVEEINTKTDIICSYDIERQGRQTTAFIFQMNTKESHV
jgi:plasmid replication initiation protein